MNADTIEDVMSELLGEGYRIVWEDGTLSPVIDWVDWIEDPEDEDKEQVKYQAIPLDKLTSPNGFFTDEEMRTFAQRMMKLLGTTDWERLAMDFHRYYTSGGNEQSNEGYF